jgi:hypothetical protein
MARLFLAIAIVLAAFGFGAGGATYLDSYQKCAADYEQQERNTNSSSADQRSYVGLRLFLRCEGVAVDANNGTLTAIGTILLAVITGWLVVVARDQTRTTRRQLRAYLGIDASAFEMLPKPDSTAGIWPNQIRLRVENSGQTPAYHVTSHLNQRWDPHIDAVPADFDFVDCAAKGGRSVAVIGAGKHSPPIGFGINAEQFANAAAGKTFLFYYGHIDYRDVFGDPHVTRFCYFLRPHGDRPGGALMMAEPHNDAT